MNSRRSSNVGCFIFKKFLTTKTLRHKDVREKLEDRRQKTGAGPSTVRHAHRRQHFVCSPRQNSGQAGQANG